MQIIQAVLLTATEQNIRDYITWAGGFVVGGFILRAFSDFIKAFEDPDMGLKEAFRKTKKRIFAAIIAITVEGTVIWLKGYF